MRQYWFAYHIEHRLVRDFGDREALQDPEAVEITVFVQRVPALPGGVVSMKINHLT